MQSEKTDRLRVHAVPQRLSADHVAVKRFRPSTISPAPSSISTTISVITGSPRDSMCRPVTSLMGRCSSGLPASVQTSSREE
jgi:hypothetical protein